MNAEVAEKRQNRGGFSSTPAELRALAGLLALSLAFMQPPVSLLGFAAVPTDFIFLALIAALLWALARRRVRLVWDESYWWIGLYLAAMVASALAAGAPIWSVKKLVTQLYLLSIPIVIVHSVRSAGDLRLIVKWWLAGTFLVILAGVGSLIAFLFDPGHVILDYTRFHFGTLPPGNYPRLRLTFLNANMACNYLTVSLVLLLMSRRLGWVGAGPFVLLLLGVSLCAALTISPGLGGIGVAVSIWMWLSLRERRPTAARLFLVGSVLIGLLFLAAMAVTPIRHSTAPFSFTLLGVELFPAGRLMIWLDAVRNFLADPLFGRGIGAESVHVPYESPSGQRQTLTDAHNSFLNIAVQCGVIGLGTIVALVAHVWRRWLPLRFGSSADVSRGGLGLAFLVGFVYEGLGGSFEDARHLWVVFGLLVASRRFAPA